MTLRLQLDQPNWHGSRYQPVLLLHRQPVISPLLELRPCPSRSDQYPCFEFCNFFYVVYLANFELDDSVIIVHNLNLPRACNTHTLNIETPQANVANNVSTGHAAMGDDTDALISRSLIQLVRDRTGINFANSRLAVHAVIQHLIDAVGDDDVAEAIVKAARADAPDGTDGGADMIRLESIFSELTGMKNDAQQRSWAVDDDFEVFSVLYCSKVPVLALMCVAVRSSLAHRFSTRTSRRTLYWPLLT